MFTCFENYNESEMKSIIIVFCHCIKMFISPIYLRIYMVKIITFEKYNESKMKSIIIVFCHCIKMFISPIYLRIYVVYG